MSDWIKDRLVEVGAVLLLLAWLAVIIYGIPLIYLAVTR